jgi:hypothetical protein
MENESMEENKVAIPSKIINKLIYIAYGGPKGVFAAIGERDLLNGLVRLSTKKYPFWQIDVLIDPNQNDFETDGKLVPLLPIVIQNKSVFVNQNGPNFGGLKILRPSSLKPLTARILKKYAVTLLEQAEQERTQFLNSLPTQS